MLEPINPIQQAIDTLFDGLLYVGGFVALIGAIYLIVNTWIFLRHLPFLDRGDD